jgi:hypothetical protein
MQYTTEYHFHSPAQSPAFELGPEFMPERDQRFSIIHTVLRLDDRYHNVLHIHHAVTEVKAEQL